jgi:hypothetical protein
VRPANGRAAAWILAVDSDYSQPIEWHGHPLGPTGVLQVRDHPNPSARPRPADSSLDDDTGAVFAGPEARSCPLNHEGLAAVGGERLDGDQHLARSRLGLSDLGLGE